MSDWFNQYMVKLVVLKIVISEKVNIIMIWLLIYFRTANMLKHMHKHDTKQPFKVIWVNNDIRHIQITLHSII